MGHYRFECMAHFNGFTVCYVPAHHYFFCMSKALIFSDQTEFHRLIDEVTKFVLAPVHVTDTHVANFLFIHHEDKSADLYTNEDTRIIAELMARRDLKADEPVSLRDVADVRRVRFNEIPFK